jgi:hypothetical protein
MSALVVVPSCGIVVELNEAAEIWIGYADFTRPPVETRQRVRPGQQSLKSGNAHTKGKTDGVQLRELSAMLKKTHERFYELIREQNRTTLCGEHSRPRIVLPHTLIVVGGSLFIFVYGCPLTWSRTFDGYTSTRPGCIWQGVAFHSTATAGDIFGVSAAAFWNYTTLFGIRFSSTVSTFYAPKLARGS